MSAIGKLLGRSPFGLLQRHMEQVAKCIAKMGESLDALQQGRWDLVDKLADEASRLEHHADQIKDDIRNHLLRRVFMPVNRAQVLEILAYQDNLADAAEDVAVLLTIKQIETPPGLIEEFQQFRELNIGAFRLALEIVGQLDELVESGFGGSEAEKIRTMVHDAAYAEHQVDVLQRKVLKKIFAEESALSAADLSIWNQLIKELGGLSNLSENLADRIQMTLDLK
ncbi:MAG: TIGR00153 family protein [Planctomycetia bacterium]|nr:MAG: TIGR00153 family protein [Planctomycetia bacterium]